jgi:TP901-1 family phage major tail protein
MRGVDAVIQVEATTPGTYVTLAGQRGASLSESAETIDVTSKSSGGAYEYDYGLYGWTMSMDGAYVLGNAEFLKLRDAMRNKTKVKVKWSETGSKGAIYSGDALVTSMELDAPYDAETTYSFELQGTGVITTTTNP